MRKAIRLKVFVMVVAWMVIFLHDTIPHNHNNSPDHNCHAVIHSAGPGSDLNPLIQEQSEHTTCLYTIFADISHNHSHSFTCHFSTGLYEGQLSEMSAAILSETSLYLFSQKTCATVTPTVISPVITPPLRLSLLRGPPRNA